MPSDYTASDLKSDVQNAARDTARDAEQGAQNLADKAKAAFDEATSSGAMGDARRRAGEIMDTAREKGHEMMDAARERGAHIAENVRSEADRLYRAGERKAGDLAVQAEDYYDEVSDMVRRQPAAALGIAAGVGFLVGLILARR